MSTKGIWWIVMVWISGLLAGHHLPLLLIWILLVAGGFGTVWPGASSRLKRCASLLLIFLLASFAGTGPDITFTHNSSANSPGLKDGLINPYFRPLLTLCNRDSTQDTPSEEQLILAEKPPWASDPVWNLIQSVLFNRRERMDASWLAAFRSVGTAHLIAVSGLHIGILLGMAIALLRLFRLRRWIVCLIGMGCTWTYVLLIGAPPSALRAGLMTSVGLIAWSAMRHTDINRILPTAVLIALVIMPSLLVSVGFQLSVSAVIGIALALRDRSAHKWHTPVAKLGIFLRVSLGAQAGILPVQIATFGTLTPLAPLVNLIAVPLMGIWLPATVAAVGLGAAGTGLEAIAGGFCEGTGRLLLWWIFIWNRVHGILLPVPRWISLVAFTGILLWRMDGKGRLAAYALLTLVIWSPFLDRGRPRISFLDVGQGDAIVIETRNPDRTIVIDSGPAFSEWSAGKSVVAPYLRSRGTRVIDLLVVSHPDIDHTGGIAALVEEFKIERYMRGNWPADTPRIARRLDNYMQDSGVITLLPRAGDRVVLGSGAWLDILAGISTGDSGISDRFMTSNDRSLVLHLYMEGLTVFLCGDLEQSGERRLITYWNYLPSTILKVPHHGGEDALSSELLEKVNPSLAIISVGAGNRHGHPSERVLKSLEARGTTIWRTDRQGALVLRARH